MPKTLPFFSETLKYRLSLLTLQLALIRFQLSMPTNRVFKRSMIFPKNEWH